MARTTRIRNWQLGEAYAHIHWLTEHLDADLARWHARRTHPLVVTGRLDPRDRTWAQGQHRMAVARALLEELETRTSVPGERETIRSLASGLERFNAAIQALSRQLHIAEDPPILDRETIALCQDLDAGRTELTDSLTAIGELPRTGGPSPTGLPWTSAEPPLPQPLTSARSAMRKLAVLLAP